MKKRYVKELLGITIAAVLFARLPVYTLAGEYYIEDGNIAVHAKETGQTVRQGSGSEQEDDAPVISNRDPDTPSGNNIYIYAEADHTANVTLDDVNIDASSSYDGFAVEASGDGNVNIELDGENKLQSGWGAAGIQKIGSGTLTISDDDKNGSLTVTGGESGAGIGGGGSHPDVKNITITGGDITATGDESGAGIGGGLTGYAENIRIEGGKVKATGGQYAAGIGGGNLGEGENITITGGEVTAAGGDYGAGIGGGLGGEGIDITIEKGEITATGGKYAAGIGGGSGDKGENIKIQSGTVTAVGSEGGAGIGGGSLSVGKDITIEDGEIVAIGSEGGAGIGGGVIYDGENITITGGKVIAIGQKGGSGIGGGSNAIGSDIIISKDSQVAVAGGELLNGSRGAAIGNGAKNGDGLEIIPDTSELYSTGFIAYYPAGTTAEQIIKGEVQPTKILVNEEASAGQGTQGGNPTQGGQQTGPDPAPVNSEAQTPQGAPAVGHSSSGSSDGDNSEVKDIPTSSEELAKFLAQTNSTLEAYIKKIEAMAVAGDTEGLNELISKGITLETGNWVCFNKKTYTLIERVSELGAPVRISFGYKGIRYSTTIPGKAEIKPTDLCNAEGYCGFLNLIKYYGKEEK